MTLRTSFRHRWVGVAALLLPLFVLAVGCGGDEPKKSAEVADPATAAPGKPPIPEDEAKRFVERFCSAMNSKDNLRLVKMVQPGGEFVIAGSGRGVAPAKMDSAAFLRWFQGALASATYYSIEARSMTWEPLPNGAVIDAQLREEYGPIGRSAKSDTRSRFFLERDDDDVVRCRRMDGGQ